MSGTSGTGIAPAMAKPEYHIHICGSCGNDFRCDYGCPTNRDPHYLLCLDCCVEIMRAIASGALETVLRPVIAESRARRNQKTQAAEAGAQMSYGGDSDGTDEGRRRETDEWVKRIQDRDEGMLSQNELEFLESCSDPSRTITSEMIFWLRDIADKVDA